MRSKQTEEETSIWELNKNTGFSFNILIFFHSAPYISISFLVWLVTMTRFITFINKFIIDKNEAGCKIMFSFPINDLSCKRFPYTVSCKHFYLRIVVGRKTNPRLLLRALPWRKRQQPSSVFKQGSLIPFSALVTVTLNTPYIVVSIVSNNFLLILIVLKFH